jgi:hypothetical protein
MTVERKIIVGLEDIKAISFQCDACQYRVTMSPDEVKEIPKTVRTGIDGLLEKQKPLSSHSCLRP